MKLVIVTLICGFIFACSSTKVHLYSRYLSEQESAEITTAIEDQGFDVIANTLAFPDEIQQSTILYSPFVQKENGVDILIVILNKKGWTIPTVQPLFTGNHFYTQDSVGLFLLPDGIGQSDKIAAQDLVNVYQSNQCESSIALHLNKEGSYQFIYENEKPEGIAALKGVWKMTSYPYIELTSPNDNWSFYFEIQQKIETDVASKIKITELAPVDTHYAFPDCSFVYGQRF